ncbi:MAG: cobalamin B12-binding domain-containing protein [Planctomycetes bacterium]|uniref:cobalamin-dependent protein n=1 Tax=Candidatus Wunengus sp. YC65 TaxID=3367701 RepID=UPI001D9DCFB2|nr:cobalamin B12-binding domain-containing protein [Planctomycetota bacterium]MBI5796497.1 cobalamin B12-binding domain-containing protein [Planctomycetota bacterium]
MKVLLFNPPFLKKFSRPQRSPAVTKSRTLYFPMWLAYATGVLGENGFDVDLIDAPADNYSIDDVIERTKKFQPSLIVLDTSTPSIYNDVAGQLKEICPSSFITLVVTHVSALSEETLNMRKSDR